jgi:hypothetical protein
VHLKEIFDLHGRGGDVEQFFPESALMEMSNEVLNSGRLLRVASRRPMLEETLTVDETDSLHG